MTEAELEKLKSEQARGSDAERTLNRFIKPFIEEKRLVLFEAFQEVSVTEIEKLLEIKRQLLVVNALEQEMQSIIDTGRMATKTLTTAEEQERTNENS